MSRKGISEITERSVNFGEFDEIDVIIYKKNFK